MSQMEVNKYTQHQENILINAGNSKRTNKKTTKDGGIKNMEKEQEIPLREEFKKQAENVAGDKARTWPCIGHLNREREIFITAAKKNALKQNTATLQLNTENKCQICGDEMVSYIISGCRKLAKMRTLEDTR